MQGKRDYIVYATLGLAWLAFGLWQWGEHNRTAEREKAALVARSNDIAGVFSLVIRSQSRENVIRIPRLVYALEDLANTNEIVSVALVKPSREKVISTGEPFDDDLAELFDGGEIWTKETLTIAHVVELGSLVDTEMPEFMPEDMRQRIREGRPRHAGGHFANITPEDWREIEQLRAELFALMGRKTRGADGSTSSTQGRGTRAILRGEKPPKMSEEEFSQFQKLDGPYYLPLRLNASSVGEDIARDRWLRLTLVGIALIAGFGVGGAWRAARRSFGLEVRLVRAQEMNTVLREMNLAAAGLAHETRNPLNIVRGMAQVVSKDDQASDEIRAKAQSIMKEVDRVASRLNEFIEFSKPREIELAPVDLAVLVGEVHAALEADFQDKEIEFDTEGLDLAVLADEPLLRQTLFNLLLNASQAVDNAGAVSVVAVQAGPKEAWLEIRDSGPGVPPESRLEIFKPYFTTREEGSGLGLAIVRQIVLAHRWDIEYLVDDEGRSVFRIRNIAIA